MSTVVVAPTEVDDNIDDIIVQLYEDKPVHIVVSASVVLPDVEDMNLNHNWPKTWYKVAHLYNNLATKKAEVHYWRATEEDKGTTFNKGTKILSLNDSNRARKEIKRFLNGYVVAGAKIHYLPNESAAVVAAKAKAWNLLLHPKKEPEEKEEGKKDDKKV